MWFFFFLLYLLIWLNFEKYLLIYYLSFCVCEGAFGISLLVRMTRFQGRDFFTKFKFIKMLKFILIRIFIIPLYRASWIYLLISFLLICLFIILELRSFKNVEILGINLGCDLMSYNLIFFKNMNLYTYTYK